MLAKRSTRSCHKAFSFDRQKAPVRQSLDSRPEDQPTSGSKPHQPPIRKAQLETRDRWHGVKDVAHRAESDNEDGARVHCATSDDLWPPRTNSDEIADRLRSAISSSSTCTPAILEKQRGACGSAIVIAVTLRNDAPQGSSCICRQQCIWIRNHNRQYLFVRHAAASSTLFACSSVRGSNRPDITVHSPPSSRAHTIEGHNFFACVHLRYSPVILSVQRCQRDPRQSLRLCLQNGCHTAMVDRTFPQETWTALDRLSHNPAEFARSVRLLRRPSRRRPQRLGLPKRDAMCMGPESFVRNTSQAPVNSMNSERLVAPAKFRHALARGCHLFANNFANRQFLESSRTPRLSRFLRGRPAQPLPRTAPATSAWLPHTPRRDSRRLPVLAPAPLQNAFSLPLPPHSRPITGSGLRPDNYLRNLHSSAIPDSKSADASAFHRAVASRSNASAARPVHREHSRYAWECQPPKPAQPLRTHSETGSRNRTLVVAAHAATPISSPIPAHPSAPHTESARRKTARAHTAPQPRAAPESQYELWDIAREALAERVPTSRRRPPSSSREPISFHAPSLKCNRMARLYSRSELIAARHLWKAHAKKVVFTNGCYDILHPGHISACSNVRVRSEMYLFSHSIPIRACSGLKALPGHSLARRTRAALALHLEAVDAVTLFEEDTPRELIAALLPDVLVKGADWAHFIAGREEVEAAGGQVHALPLEPGYSTTRYRRKNSFSPGQPITVTHPATRDLFQSAGRQTDFQSLLQHLTRGERGPFSVSGLVTTAKALYLVLLYQATEKSLIVLVDGNKQAETLLETIEVFFDMLFEGRDLTPPQLIPALDVLTASAPLSAQRNLPKSALSGSGACPPKRSRSRSCRSLLPFFARNRRASTASSRLICASVKKWRLKILPNTSKASVINAASRSKWWANTLSAAAFSTFFRRKRPGPSGSSSSAMRSNPSGSSTSRRSARF